VATLFEEIPDPGDRGLTRPVGATGNP
jgi:hypothetical protein